MERPLYFVAILLVPLFGLTSASPWSRPAPEICDNALDDDLDGLTDLQDPDCACGAPVIPNGSFEESVCCPAAPSQDYCIRYWKKASLSTPDYVSKCEWLGWEQFPVPLPMPDGQACIGFRNGRFEARIRPEEKEYIGMCMKDHPLEANTTYHFSFYVGFSEGAHSPAGRLAFFGTSDCKNFPAGIDRPTMVCPGDEESWFLIKDFGVSGTNTWLHYEFDYSPAQPVMAIAIGPDCTFATSKADIYYYFDNLIVKKKPLFPVTVMERGAPCSRRFALEVVRSDTLHYQWYRDQIALVGETSYHLDLNGRKGKYQVAISSPSGCALTDPYYYQPSTLAGELRDVICDGKTYLFNGRAIREPGFYQDTVLTKEGCDSVVTLVLDHAEVETDSQEVRIFEGESYRVGDQSYNRPGSYEYRIPKEQGCDSLIHLDLDFFKIFFPNAFSPNDDAVNDQFTVFGGPGLDRILSLDVFDRWGGFVWEGRDLAPNDEAGGWDGKRNGKPLPEGIYLYNAILLLEDGSRKSHSGSLLLIR